MSDTIPPRRRKKKRGCMPWILLIVAFLVAAVAGAIFAGSSSLFDKHTNTKNNLSYITPQDKTIVMIMGVDQRDDDVGRSDTLMVATLDPNLNKASLLSIPRDTRVKIKGNGFDKINAAYAYGGEKLTQDTVEQLLGVSMEHYIMIDVHAFQRIIDAIGGVDIDVEKRMYYEDPWDDDGGLVIDLYPGEQHMDGKTAMTYVRYRDEEGDIGRIARQQKFMKSLMDKVTSPSIITSMPTIIKEVFSSIKTDLSIRQLVELASSLKDAQKNGLTAEMVPGKPMYIDGVSYWIPDLNKLRYIVADTLGVNLSGSAVSAIEEDSREYESSIPSNAKEIEVKDPELKKMINEANSSSRSRYSSDKKNSYTSERDTSKKSSTDSSERNYDTGTSSNKENQYYGKSSDDSSADKSSNTSRHPSVDEGNTTVIVPDPGTSDGKKRQ